MNIDAEHLLHRAAEICKPLENFIDYYRGWRPESALDATALLFDPVPSIELAKASRSLTKAYHELELAFGFDSLWKKCNTPQERATFVRRLFAAAMKISRKKHAEKEA